MTPLCAVKNTITENRPKHFSRNKTKDIARFQLSELKQDTSEKLSDYYAKLRTHENDVYMSEIIWYEQC
jgi:hypothetical protein